MDLEQAWQPDLFNLKPVVTGYLLWTAFWWNDKKKEHCALGLRSALGHIWIVTDSRHHSSGGCHYPQFSYFHQCRDLFLLDWKLFQQLQGAAIQNLYIYVYIYVYI